MSLLDFFFPKKCVGCAKKGEYLCPACFSQLSFATDTKCLVCERVSFAGLTHPGCKTRYSIDGYVAGVSYRKIAKKLLYQFKYKPYLTDLQTLLVDLLYENLLQNELFTYVTRQHAIFVPIPLSKGKLRKRGYNQSEILAKGLGKKLGLPVENVLNRVRDTNPQYGLKKEERRMNMKGAFALVHRSSFMVHGKIALLVDDVVTTGSTLKEAAKILKKNGFKKVYGVVFAQD